MADTGWERLAAGTGILFVVLAAVAYFLAPQPPAPNAPAGDIAGYYTGNRDGLLIQSVVFALGGAALLWFLGSLRSALRTAEGGTGRLSAVSFGAGLLVVALAYGAGALFTVAALYLAPQSGTEGVIGFTHTLGNVTFHMATFPAAVLLAAAAVVTLREGGLPSWLGWLGGLFGIAILVHGAAGLAVDTGFLAIGDVFGQISFFGFLAWILLASGVLVQRAGSPATG
ncbi:MAG: hypothetical protein ACRDI0_03315 [Actinomycetota bacterium]